MGRRGRDRGKIQVAQRQKGRNRRGGRSRDTDGEEWKMRELEEGKI